MNADVAIEKVRRVEEDAAAQVQFSRNCSELAAMVEDLAQVVRYLLNDEPQLPLK